MKLLLKIAVITYKEKGKLFWNPKGAGGLK
jgi:hypothetical protein